MRLLPRMLLPLAAVWAAFGCTAPTNPAAAPPERGAAALEAATAYLVRAQAPEGAWRSDVYGAFKEGDALTPLVLAALQSLPESAATRAAIDRGTAYLGLLVGPDGRIVKGPRGLSFPAYSAALAVLALAQPRDDAGRHARDAWLAYLRERQLVEPLGWQPADREYGGWGYAHGLPRKPGPGASVEPLTESNLSATAFALAALRAAGVPAADPACRKALVFLERCQNYTTDPAAHDPAFDDGGFFFIYDDPVRNKAGVAGTDRAGRQRFVSYGSTTADGLRSLLACGLPADHPRVRAARSWLEARLHEEGHPGRYPTDREMNRPALYFYYLHALAGAFAALPGGDVQGVPWQETLANALIERQRPDGSWRNPAVAVREDDPLVATALAVMALAVCRQ